MSFFVKLLLGNLLLVAVIVGLGAVASYSSLDARHRENSQAYQDRLAAGVGKREGELVNTEVPSSEGALRQEFDNRRIEDLQTNRQ